MTVKYTSEVHQKSFRSTCPTTNEDNNTNSKMVPATESSTSLSSRDTNEVSTTTTTTTRIPTATTSVENIVANATATAAAAQGGRGRGGRWANNSSRKPNLWRMALGIWIACVAIVLSNMMVSRRDVFVIVSGIDQVWHANSSNFAVVQVGEEIAGLRNVSLDDKDIPAGEEETIIGKVSEDTYVVDCFKYNSKEWVVNNSSSPRFTNMNHSYMDSPEYLKQWIVDVEDMLTEPGRAERFLTQTLAFPTSKFANDRDENQGTESVRMWSIRLMYLSMYYHQHVPALEEAKWRIKNYDQCRSELQTHGIGPFDFECQGTKYISIGLSGNGVGSHVNVEFYNVYQLALALNRTALITQAGSKGRDRTWQLASCGRKDYQCTFAPPGPCLPTRQQFNARHILDKKSINSILKDDKVPDLSAEIMDNVVWRVEAPSLVGRSLLRSPDTVLKRHTSNALKFIENVPDSDPRLPVLQKAIESIAEVDNIDESLKIKHGLVRSKVILTAYALRPNHHSYEKIQSHLSRIDQWDQLDPTQSLGLPIRASDKCLKESDCPSFLEYLHAATDLWTKSNHPRQYNHSESSNTSAVTNLLSKSSPSSSSSLAMPSSISRNVTIIFTTESPDVIEHQKQFSNSSHLQSLFPYNLNFVRNDEDVLPGSGFARDWGRPGKPKITADDNMISVFVATKLQLFPKVGMGNCCSNLHVVFAQFHFAGMSASPDGSVFTCMQDMGNRAFYVDCWGSKKQKVGSGGNGLYRVDANGTIILPAVNTNLTIL